MILQSSLSFPTYWYGYNRGMSNEEMSKQGKPHRLAAVEKNQKRPGSVSLRMGSQASHVGGLIPNKGQGANEASRTVSQTAGGILATETLSV